MFKPRGPRDWPILGDGFATPAKQYRRTLPFILGRQYGFIYYFVKFQYSVLIEKMKKGQEQVKQYQKQEQGQQSKQSKQSEKSEQKLLDDPFSDPKQLAHFKRIVASFLNYTVIRLSRLMSSYILHRHYRLILCNKQLEYNEILMTHELKDQISNIYSNMTKIKKQNDLNNVYKQTSTSQIKLFKIICICFNFIHRQYWKIYKSNITIQANGAGPLLQQLHVSYKEVLRMRSTVKQFARQWSEQGKPQREQCYTKILNELQIYFPSTKIAIKNNSQTNNDTKTDKKYRLVKVLHPGSGLGRLPYQCAKRGYASQGNQYTYLMLLGSNFLLNCIHHQKQFSFYPYIHNLSNNRKYDDALREVKIPDECPPFELPKDGDFSMVAGDFLQVYKDQINQWDCLITCFFIDTANNILQYISLIHQVLRVGGVWINFGPLLYHFTDLQDECSIELSWEEVRFAVQKIGFEIKVILYSMLRQLITIRDNHSNIATTALNQIHQ